MSETKLFLKISFFKTIFLLLKKSKTHGKEQVFSLSAHHRCESGIEVRRQMDDQHLGRHFHTKTGFADHVGPLRNFTAPSQTQAVFM